MLDVRMVAAEDGSYLSVSATGHAAGRPGENIACAAGTVLLRTAARWLVRYPGIQIDGSAPNEGVLAFEAVREPRAAAGTDVLLDLAGYLETGLRDLEREFPRDVGFSRVSGTGPQLENS